MRELSLFTGAGGGLLGTHLLGWTPIGYVEYDDYCQRVIAQRIRDGILPNAPIFGDIRTFISDGYAASYQGLVDVISGGFPCQPFSNAGNRLGADDSRNMWPATIECIRIIQPRFALLENVPGLLSSGYFGTVLGDLVTSGYDASWRILSAAELGAPHRRDRVWIMAYSGGERRTQSYQRIRRQFAQRQEVKRAWNGRRVDQPGIVGVVDGMAYQMDRLRAIGNGQVPAVVRAAWHLLTEGLDTEKASIIAGPGNPV